METIKELESRISELKEGRTLKVLKQEDKKSYYKVKSLTSKLSELKSYDKGQFITKEHLTEYKGLIIWLLKNKCNFNGLLDLKKSMTLILNEVESNKVVYITERGIKGIISNLTISIGLDSVYDSLLERYEIDLTRQSTLNCKILQDYQTFKLNQLM